MSGQVIEGAGLFGSGSMAARGLAAADAGHDAVTGFLDAERERHALVLRLRSVMARRAAPGQETAVLTVLLALVHGEVRCAALRGLSGNASSAVAGLEAAGFLEAVEAELAARRDRRVRRLRLTALGQELALALADEIGRGRGAGR